MGYQPFLVAPSNTGISKYLKPWLQPEDALVDMEDCYTYRGVIQKRYGFALYDTFPSGIGINQFGTGNGTTTTFNGTLSYATVGNPVGRRSLQISHTQGGVLITDGTDDGAGTITGTNIAGGSTINYATGAVTINFTAAPDNATGIRINYGIRVAVGNGTIGPYNVTLPTTAPFGLPIKDRSVYIKESVTNQESNPLFDVPNPDGLTGDITNPLAPPKVTAGTITYATANIPNLTFTNVIAIGDDIWAKWEFQAASNPIKGIKFFWTANSTQDTLVFNNNEVARFDPNNFKLTNITGGTYFSTSVKAFFSVANYLGRAFILNNTDRLTVWDGTFLTRPVVSFNSATPTVNDLTTGLLVFIYKNRIVVLRPTESGTVRPQRARFSALNNPFSWFSDVQGQGGFIDAPTPEWIIGAEFLRDELIVHFQESTWKLRYTANDIQPYRWEKINESRRVDAPYATVGYQEFETSLGTTGLLQCDSVNVKRYDDKIIDFTSTELNQDDIDVCNSYRFDNLNQQFICYPSSAPELQTTDYCDKWLVWNFLENSFSKFNIAATTFGSYFQGRDLAWQDFNAANQLDYAWSDFQDENWFSFFTQGKAKLPVFGTKDGKVNQLMPFFATDEGVRTGFSFTTKDFNPFVKDGQKVQFGYVDFYFDRPSDFPTLDPNYLLTIDFFIDENPYPITSIILNPSEDDWQKKRVFVNITAQFHRFKIYLSDDQIANSTVATRGFTLNGYILWMSPGGRING